MMEYVIGICVFLFLAKKGLAKQGLSVDIKGAASDVAANVTLELCDVLDIKPTKVTKK